MLQLSFIGCGAAGNKVAIKLMEKEIISRKNTTLINSTLKDIPNEFRENAIIFSDDPSMGGCGKERDRGKTILLNSLQQDKINLDSIPNPGDKMIIICASVEGGSGSASAPILAKYFHEVLGLNVCLLLIFGFEDDIRGMQNSIEVAQELSDDYTIISVSNKKFLDISNGNRTVAEKLANAEIYNRMKVLMGMDIIDAEQNIDDTDLYKIVTTPGYTDIGFIELPKVKNTAQYNQIINSFIDNSKSLDINEPSATRLGVIFNINKKNEDFIDLASEVLRQRFGLPYEYFYHVQYTEGAEWVEFISSGMDLPLEEIVSVYNRYKESTSKVKKSKDSFFKDVADLRGDPEDSMFNMNGQIQSEVKKPTASDKTKFFNDFSFTNTPKKDSKFSNTKVHQNNDESKDI